MEEKALLQAVVVADSFNSALHPITEQIPKAQVHLVNTPLIDYTLDWLQRNGIDEVIVYCRAQPHGEEIKNHCKRFFKKNKCNTSKLTTILSEDCDAIGDVLRDLYEKAILKNNFILMHGDIIANIDLKQIIQKHKDVVEKDKSAIMTCVYMPEPKHLNTEVDNEDYVTLVTASNDGPEKILTHQRCTRYSRSPALTEHVLSHKSISILQNQLDPCIAICTDVVPSLFSDNFDYRTRDNLINGVVEQEELLGYSIYAYVAKEGYAKRVTSFNSYQTVSEDIVNRNTYPEVAEISLTSHRVRYSYDPFYRNYWEGSAKYTKKSLGVGNVIGAGCDINPSSNLSNTVLGDHCIVHKSVRCKNSFIQSNAVINSGCKLEKCYVGNGSILLKNVTLSPGCVVGPGVTIGPNIVIPNSTKFSKASPAESDPFWDKSKPIPRPNPKFCGKEGNGYVCPVNAEDENSNLRIPVWGEEIKDFIQEDSDNDSGDSDDEDKGGEDVADGDGPPMDEDDQRDYDFKQEVTDSLVNAYLENSISDKVVLEINASRHAYNVSMEHVLATVIEGVICLCQHKSINSNDGKLWPLVKKSLNQFADVLRNYIKKSKDQVMVLDKIEELSSNPTYLPLIQGTIHELNQNLEILDDEVIVWWFKKGGAGTPAFQQLSPSISKFVEWLKAEDEDDEETEDDE